MTLLEYSNMPFSKDIGEKMLTKNIFLQAEKHFNIS